MIIIRKAAITYCCTNIKCQETVRLNISFPTLISANKLPGRISHTKPCHKCTSNSMGISKISCDILEDEFGSEKHGAWLCQKHTARIYYPIPLRHCCQIAWDSSTYRRTYAHYLTKNGYKAIVEKGFPWKCPQCGERLKYVDERG